MNPTQIPCDKKDCNDKGTTTGFRPTCAKCDCELGDGGEGEAGDSEDRFRCPVSLKRTKDASALDTDCGKACRSSRLEAPLPGLRVRAVPAEDAARGLRRVREVDVHHLFGQLRARLWVVAG